MSFKACPPEEGPPEEAADAEHWHAWRSGSGGTSLLVLTVDELQALLEPAVVVCVHLCASVAKQDLRIFCFLCGFNERREWARDIAVFDILSILLILSGLIG
jgi:hypothetical protein